MQLILTSFGDGSLGPLAELPELAVGDAGADAGAVRGAPSCTAAGT